MLPIGIGILALGAFGAAVNAAVKQKRARTIKRPAKISPQVYDLAAKWAKKRGLPLQWVLSTILVESGGDQYLKGDCREFPECKSLGLMQVNWYAHGDRLRREGVALTREALFDPDTNIAAGTLFLREAWQKVAAELGGRKPPAPLDLLVRFAYKGPGPTASALRQGKHPREVFKDGDLVVARWSRALAETSAVA